MKDFHAYYQFEYIFIPGLMETLKEKLKKLL